MDRGLMLPHFIILGCSVLRQESKLLHKSLSCILYYIVKSNFPYKSSPLSRLLIQFAMMSSVYWYLCFLYELLFVILVCSSFSLPIHVLLLVIIIMMINMIITIISWLVGYTWWFINLKLVLRELYQPITYMSFRTNKLLTCSEIVLFLPPKISINYVCY